MVLLELLGIAGSAIGIAALAEKSSQKAYPKLNKKEFDAENASHGIAHCGFSDEKIMKIAARCGVKPNKDGVLPQHGKNLCMSYVGRYANSEEDLVEFKGAWNRVVKTQLCNLGKTLQDPNGQLMKNYDYKAAIINRRGHGYFGGPNIVLEVTHWHGISKQEQLYRMQQLQEKTVWGDICIKQPRLRNNPYVKDAFIEVWTIHSGHNDRQDKKSTIKKYKQLYRDCCAKLGYNAML